MKHYVTAPIFDNDGGFVFCSGKFIEYYDLNELKYTDYDADVTCELCLEKLEKIEQLKEKFKCKCNCHNTNIKGEIKAIGYIKHIRNKLVCCLYCPFCKISINVDLEKEHEQFHLEKKDI